MVEQFAIGLASGLSVREWATRHGVPLPTAYRWRQAAPGFKARVESHRKILVKRELEAIADHAAQRMSLGSRNQPMTAA